MSNIIFPALDVNQNPVNIAPAVSGITQLETARAQRQYYGAQTVEAQERANQLKIQNQFASAFNQYRLNALNGSGGAPAGAPGAAPGGGPAPSAGSDPMSGAVPPTQLSAGGGSNAFGVPPGYESALAIGDPSGLNQLQQAQRTQQETQQGAVAFQQKQMAQRANVYSSLKDPGDRADYFHQMALDDLSAGRITPDQFVAEGKMSAPQRDQFVAARIASLLPPDQFYDITGIKAGNVANAELPANATKALLENAGRITPLTGTQRPVTGAEVMGVNSPADLLKQLPIQPPSLVPATAGAAAAPGAPGLPNGINIRQPPGSLAPPDPGAIAPPPGLADQLNGGTTGGAAGAAPPAQATVTIGDGRQIAVPRVPLPQTPLRDTAGNVQGPSLSLIDAQQKASDEYHEDLKDADAANESLPGLKTLEAGLKSGQFQTGALTPMRAVISKYVQAVTGDDGMAKTLTGVDPAQADVFNKDASRLGLTFARQTEGARESLQAIKIALGANPSLATTQAANQMIVQMLQRDAQYRVDTGRAAQAYLTQNGHSLGFGSWWQSKDGVPATDYSTGKVAPYELPVSGQGPNLQLKLEKGMLLPGFYYKNGKGQTAVWNGTQFLPPSQYEASQGGGAPAAAPAPGVQ